jgi:hypothetical protein
MPPSRMLKSKISPINYSIVAAYSYWCIPMAQNTGASNIVLRVRKNYSL